jgi:hypothetical protein
MHNISPDTPQIIVSALSEYEWEQVPAEKIATMMERMNNMIGELPAKPSHWAWSG